MKVALAVLLPLLVGQTNMPPKEQTHFCVECEVSHPASLPPAALKALLTTEDERGEHDELKRCAQRDGISVYDIPESWFVASRLTWDNGKASGFVVQAKNACLWGAHIGPFWVLQHSDVGYRVLFAGRADGLNVLQHHTNGHQDLDLMFLLKAGESIGYSTFCYESGKYRLCGKRTEPAR